MIKKATTRTKTPTMMMRMTKTSNRTTTTLKARNWMPNLPGSYRHAKPLLRRSNRLVLNVIGKQRTPSPARSDPLKPYPKL